MQPCRKSFTCVKEVHRARGCVCVCVCVFVGWIASSPSSLPLAFSFSTTTAKPLKRKRFKTGKASFVAEGWILGEKNRVIFISLHGLQRFAKSVILPLWRVCVCVWYWALAQCLLSVCCQPYSRWPALRGTPREKNRVLEVVENRGSPITVPSVFTGKCQ